MRLTNTLLTLILIAATPVPASEATTSTLEPPPSAGQSPEEFDKMIAYYQHGYDLWMREASKLSDAKGHPESTALGKAVKYQDAKQLAVAAKVKQSAVGGIVSPLPLPVTRNGYRDIPTSGTVTVLNESDYILKTSPFPMPAVDRLYETYRDLATTHYRMTAQGGRFQEENLQKARSAEAAYLDLLAAHKQAIAHGKVIEVTPAPVLHKIAKPQAEAAVASQAQSALPTKVQAAAQPTPDAPSKFVKLEDSKFSTQTFKGKWVVEFGSPYCGICKIMKPVVNEVASAAAADIKFGSLDATKSPRQSTRFKIRSFPTYLLMKNGQLVDTHEGMMSKAKFAEFVAQ